MLRTIGITLGAAVLSAIPMFAAANLLPARFAGAAATGTTAVQPADPGLFDEFGFEKAEHVKYGPVTVTAWRFRDSTGAMSAFQSMRPAKGTLIDRGNYVIEFDGKVPAEPVRQQLYSQLPEFQHSALPVISTYLPTQGLIANSERYITGPVALAKFEPRISPSMAAFHLSAEAQVGRYRTKSGEMDLVIFDYPTPAMARQRVDEFRKLPNSLAKRTGPLVIVIPNVANADDAERLLAKVTYEANITLNEKPPNAEVRSFARTILDYMALAGVIIVFCVFSGVLFAGVRMLARRLGANVGDESMITLHIER